MQIGFLGLGKMGSRMVEKLLGGGHEVVAWNRTQDVISNFQLSISNFQYSSHFLSSESIGSLVKILEKPRVIWLMLPSGNVTESMITEVAQYLDKGDILIDGGNSNFKDTERRNITLAAKGIKFLGIGVSGGVHAVENGYPLMVGGDESAYKIIVPLLDTLSKPRGGHTYFGVGGAGHFVKMVHNGIEYGMMQAIGEGFGVMDKSPYHLDLLKVAKLWQKSTIVSGFLIDRAKDALEKDKKLSDKEGVISASGEGEWTVQQGKEEGVPVENIEQSVNFRERSNRDELVRSSFAAKMVSALRYEFGGHLVKKKE